MAKTKEVAPCLVSSCQETATTRTAPSSFNVRGGTNDLLFFPHLKWNVAKSILEVACQKFRQ